MIDHSKLPLGKRPFSPKAKDLHLKSYIDKAAIITAAQVPAAPDWQAFSCPDGNLPPPDTDALGNDRAGCCVFAGPGHHINMIHAQLGDPNRVSSTDVLSVYTKYTGYNPATGANDNGYVVRDMLGNWVKDGLYGTYAIAYALVDWTDPVETAIATWLGCGTIGGYALPIAAQGQSDDQGRQLWDVPAGGWPQGKGPGTWGGHCMWVRGSSPKLTNANSWGQDTIWTMPWQKACCDEMWVVLVDKWIAASGQAPNGFAYQDLLNDVKARSL